MHTLSGINTSFIPSVTNSTYAKLSFKNIKMNTQLAGY